MLAAVSVKTMTRQQFEALAPDAFIEINGERIQGELLARTKTAFGSKYLARAVHRRISDGT